MTVRITRTYPYTACTRMGKVLDIYWVLFSKLIKLQYCTCTCTVRVCHALMEIHIAINIELFCEPVVPAAVRCKSDACHVPERTHEALSIRFAVFQHEHRVPHFICRKPHLQDQRFGIWITLLSCIGSYLISSSPNRSFSKAMHYELLWKLNDGMLRCFYHNIL